MIHYDDVYCGREGAVRGCVRPGWDGSWWLSFKSKERTCIMLISFPVPCKICGAIPPFLIMVTKYSVD